MTHAPCLAESAAPPPVRRPRMVDVALLAGVSTSTVSKVVNDRYGVSPLTVRRVRDAIDQLGYVPDLAASALRGGTTHVIGLFVAELGRWESDVLRGATAEALSRDYRMWAFVGERVTLAGGTGPAASVRLTGSMVDGAIVVADRPVEAFDGLPTVVVESRAGCSPADGEELGREACVRLMRQLG